jgi:hypothetical protein
MKQLRRVHNYLGVFFAPVIIVFALSGALQTFRLQETRGYGGTPPGWIVALASFHKDQALPRAGPAGEDADHDRPRPPEGARPPEEGRKGGGGRSNLPLKLFVVALSTALVASTLLGVLIALNNRTTRTTSLLLLGLGAVLPILLLLG